MFIYFLRNLFSFFRESDVWEMGMRRRGKKDPRIFPRGSTVGRVMQWLQKPRNMTLRTQFFIMPTLYMLVDVCPVSMM